MYRIYVLNKNSWIGTIAVFDTKERAVAYAESNYHHQPVYKIEEEPI